MSKYIQNPISHPEWNPSMGDFFSKRVFEEDKLHEKKQSRKKLFISSLLFIHVLMLSLLIFYFS
jgi:hypothetical protein